MSRGATAGGGMAMNTLCVMQEERVAATSLNGRTSISVDNICMGRRGCTMGIATGSSQIGTHRITRHVTVG